MTAKSEVPIRVLLADDHPLFLRGVRDLLEATTDFIVTGEATTGPRASRLVTETQPDVAVLDVSMPGMSGILVMKQLLEEGCPTRFVLLSAHEDPAIIRQGLAAGARAYLLKRSAGELLPHAIAAAYECGLYIDPVIAGRFVQTCDVDRLPGARLMRTKPSLTEREREVMKLIAFGFSNKEVAGKLGVTSKSVETYKSRASEKLAIRSRSRIVEYAVLQGWFSDLSC